MRFLGVFLLWLGLTLGWAEDGPLVLIVRPDQPDFVEGAAAIRRELGPHYRFETILATSRVAGPSAEDLAASLARRPRLVVAFDNPCIAAALAATGSGGPPVIAAMGLNLAQELVRGQASGVAFEVAPFTLVTRFQEVSRTRIRAVLLPYRGTVFAAQVEDARRQLDRAGIRVVARDLTVAGDDPQRIAWTLERHLAEWVAEDGIDAVVVPSDSGLVNRRLMPLWTKVARQSTKPFLSGIGALVSERLSFCVFAAFPDPQGIGTQVSQQVAHVIEEGGNLSGIGIEPPVQVMIRIDPAQARRLGLTFRDGAEEGR